MLSAMRPYRDRHVDSLLRRLLDAHPAVMVHGPRASGKTTTAAQLATGIARLDVAAEAAIFRADPDAALAAYPDRPLLIDEWQEVPEVMGAIKRAVDGGALAGSFLLTGSVRAQADEATWPGTGRVLDIHMGPLTERELRGALDGPGLLGHVAQGFPTGPVAGAPNVVEYLDLALRGGFPEPALVLPARESARWYASYVEQVARRDALTLLRRADPDRVRRYIEAYALNSAGVADHATIFGAAGINRKTAEGYEATLERLFVVEAVPAWWSNRLKRLIHRPKRFMADAALMVAGARLDRRAVLRDGALLGRVVETFVYAQVRGELAARQPELRLHHLRTEGGRQEVDLIVDLGARRVVGVEVKAGANVERDDALHLIWLRDRLGDDFVLGVVLHTGPSVYPLADRIVAAPICTLWTP
jgi:predicted AAA+ superfamily ATPase